MHRYVTYAFLGLLLLFVLYRRVRRAVGFQRLVPAQLWVQTAMFAVICALILQSGVLHPTMLAADLVGIAVGATLAVVAMRATLVEQRDDACYYRPHPWIGMAVALVFIVRLGYRFVGLHAGVKGGGTGFPLRFQEYSSDPVTTGVYFLVAAYWGVFNASLLRRGAAAGRSAQADAGVATGTPQ